MNKFTMIFTAAICGFGVMCDCNDTASPNKPQPPATYKPRVMVMKDLPGGTFIMGADDGSAGMDQRPPHSVTISPFSIQETEVTQGQYIALMGVNPSWLNFSYSEHIEDPVEQASWYDAVLFCNKLSKNEKKDTVYRYTSIVGTPGNGCTLLDSIQIDYTKKGYRLPTEAEWEYACRGGTTTIYWWGDYIGTAEANAWHRGNSNSSTHSVASKVKNPYGLYDITGNVWEWCNDWYAWYDSTYSTTLIDPKGPDTAWSEYPNRVIRGGSWYADAFRLRSAYRHAWPSGSQVYYVGFRVVLPK